MLGAAWEVEPKTSIFLKRAKGTRGKGRHRLWLGPLEEMKENSILERGGLESSQRVRTGNLNQLLTTERAYQQKQEDSTVGLALTLAGPRCRRDAEGGALRGR